MGSTDGVLSDYPVKFVLHSGSGTDRGEDVYLNNHSLSWPYDVRFTDSNDQQLSYWIESSDNDQATVWVKLPAIPASPGNATVKVYYGNSGDKYAGNASDVFLFYDDFSGAGLDRNKWPSNSGTNAIVMDGVLIVNSASDSGYRYLMSVDFKPPVRMVCSVKSIPAANTHNIWGMGPRTDRDVAAIMATRTFLDDPMMRTQLNSYQQTLGNTFVTDDTSFHRYEYIWTRHFALSVDDSPVGVISTNVPTVERGVTFGGDVANIQCDYVFVSKYTPNEPVHGDWSDEKRRGSTICPGISVLVLLPFLIIGARRLR